MEKDNMRKASQKPDIFDKVMSVKPFSVFEPFYKKNKSVLLYLFFGGLTTVISIFTFWLANLFFDSSFSLNIFSRSYQLGVVISNVISWICAVLFAFFTNRIWVFNSPTETWSAFFKQLISFFGGRFATLILETLILVVFVSAMHFNEMIIKIIAQIIIVITNYVISKLFVFKKTNKS